MAADRVPLSRVLEIQLPLSWQEAVAITEEVALAQADRRRLGHHPARVDEASIVLTTGGRIDFARDDPEARADGELQLLRALLTGRAVPAELEALAYGPPPTSLLDALSMFSRPDRQTPIAAVARRTLEAERELPPLIRPQAAASPAGDATPAPARPEQAASPGVESAPELEQLRARTRSQRHAEPPRKDRPRSRPPAGRSRHSRAVVAIAALAAAGAAAAILVPRFTATSEDGAAPTAEASPATPPAGAAGAQTTDAPEATSLVGRALSLVREALADPRAPRARTTDIALPPTRRAATRHAATEPAAAVATASAPTAATTSHAPADAPPPAEPPAAPAAASTPSDEDVVHSWRTSDAAPPVMTYPRMPRSAFPEPVEAVEGPYLEVLVDADGAVEGVWLRGPATSSDAAFRHSMMMSAAKAWRFVPAQRDGRPVRYVMRVVLRP